MENGTAAEDTEDFKLALEGGRILTIAKLDLVIQGESAVKIEKRSKTGSPDRNGPLSVPLYNVLWAEVSAGNIIIDYANQLKAAMKPEKLTFALASSTTVEAQETTPDAFISALLSRAYGEAQRERRAYVLINPNSGPGNGLRKWENEVKPLFAAARMSMEVVVLKRGGEATELAEKVDIDKYDTIIPCSGDGTPHEVFNGLAKRPDARTALTKMAVAHVPCGSGNAMSCNLYGSHKPSFAALAIIKGVVTPLDLVSVTQGNRRLISFLSQALGIIAESDLGTEHLRWMGSMRFDFGVISRLFKKRCYPCDIAVKVEYEKDDVKDHYRRFTTDARTCAVAPTQTNGEQHDVGLPKLKHGTIQDDLPEGWELVSYDKIGNFYCGNMAYMAPDVNFFSAAIAADGCLDMITINGNLSPATALKTFLMVDSGKFFDNQHVRYKKISAYRIIPRNQKDGYISIDGEKVPFEPFQAEVHQALGRVISKRGGYEAEGPANWDKVTVSERLHA